MTDDPKRAPDSAVFKRLILRVGKEAHLKGVDVEAEVTSILAKLHAKSKPPVDPGRR